MERISTKPSSFFCRIREKGFLSSGGNASIYNCSICDNCSAVFAEVSFISIFFGFLPAGNSG